MATETLNAPAMGRIALSADLSVHFCCDIERRLIRARIDQLHCMASGEPDEAAEQEIVVLEQLSAGLAREMVVTSARNARSAAIISRLCSSLLAEAGSDGGSWHSDVCRAGLTNLTAYLESSAR